MPVSAKNNYQRLFIKLALKRIPHHLALHAAVKFNSKWLIDKLNAYAVRHYVASQALMQFSENDIHAYRQAAEESVLWHGTGRYKHDGNYTADVFNSILNSKSLQPVEDAYAIFSSGEIMHSISLTRFRVIARSYADMFGHGFQEENRYGDALMWTSYHYGLFYARLYGLHLPTLKRYYAKWHSLTHDENGHNTWGKKANKNAQDVWDIFGLGSDIKNNYPILLGIKNITDVIPLDPKFRNYEVRIGRKILLSEINHIEVPLAKVNEIKKMLSKQKLKIPVFAIELGEVADSKKQFNELLGITRKA